MGNTAPVPPGDGPPPDDDEDLDELELTSIMDGEQARELRRVARLAHEAHEPHEGDRVTARPLRADDTVDVNVVIPRAPPLPTESLPTPVQAWSASEPPVPAPSMTWLVLAFLLLAAVIAFELR